MRVDTDILKEAADSRVKICKRLEDRSLELQRLIKELESYEGFDDICSQARDINAGLIKDILRIRQMGIALHLGLSSLKILEDRLCDETKEYIPKIQSRLGYLGR